MSLKSAIRKQGIQVVPAIDRRARMFDMKEDKRQYFGIEQGDNIKALLDIIPEKSYGIFSHKLNGSGELEEVVLESMT